MRHRLNAMPDEVELLLRCLGGSEAIPAALDARDGEGWDRLLRTALRHGLGPLLHRRFADVPCPDAVRSALRDVYVCSDLRNRSIGVELAAVLRALQGAGVPVIVLKGAHLAERVYPDPALRPMIDLDLLIPGAQMSVAARRLAELGYSRACPEGMDYRNHHHLRPFVRADAVPVELHRTLAAEGGSFRVDVAGLWRRSRFAEIAGVRTRVLSPEDLLLHLCLHLAASDRFQGPLLQLHDIATLLRRKESILDWPRLVDTANAWGAGRFAFCALGLAARELRAPVSDDCLTDLRHGAADRGMVALAQEFIRADPLDLPVVLQRMRGTESPADRVRAMIGAIFPAPDRLRRMYPIPSGSAWLPWYYLVRPLDLLRRYGGTLTATVRQPGTVTAALAREEKRRTIERWVLGGGPTMAVPEG